jgi:hypothetical protein
LPFRSAIAILDIMSSTDRSVQMQMQSGPLRQARRLVGWLLILAALQTLGTIGHFVYGAHVYDDPAREHVILPALSFLALAAALGVGYRWRPHGWLLWLFGAEVAFADVGLFGLFHGGFNHALKDIFFFLGGMDPDRLAQIFDSPDFAVPRDALFELTGVAGLLLALVIVCLLVRLIGAAHRQRQEARSCA